MVNGVYVVSHGIVHGTVFTDAETVQPFEPAILRVVRNESQRKPQLRHRRRSTLVQPVDAFFPDVDYTPISRRQ